jgi:hypothetical protein
LALRAPLVRNKIGHRNSRIIKIRTSRLAGNLGNWASCLLVFCGHVGLKGLHVDFLGWEHVLRAFRVFGLLGHADNGGTRSPCFLNVFVQFGCLDSSGHSPCFLSISRRFWHASGSGTHSPCFLGVFSRKIGGLKAVHGRDAFVSSQVVLSA